MERAIARFAKAPDGGLILTASLFSVVHRDLIISLADRHKLPAVYLERFFVAAGGLLSYGRNVVDQFRQAAAYVDRILKGEQPADLPVQAPTRYELVINLKTAKALSSMCLPRFLRGLMRSLSSRGAQEGNPAPMRLRSPFGAASAQSGSPGRTPIR
jgi:putative ABC transport system substrate-binding protein